jgi:hypothetical protein
MEIPSQEDEHVTGPSFDFGVYCELAHQLGSPSLSSDYAVKQRQRIP